MRHPVAVRLLALVAATCVVVGCSAGSGHPAQRRPAHNARQVAAAGKRGAAARTRLVSYHGVHVGVPASWPVVDGIHTGGCGDRYRLWLARLTTTGSDNELAWVAYGKPLTSVAGCGGWGLDAFDANTGHGIESAGWAPGP
jgi:hypothetical protein